MGRRNPPLPERRKVRMKNVKATCADRKTNDQRAADLNTSGQATATNSTRPATTLENLTTSFESVHLNALPHAHTAHPIGQTARNSTGHAKSRRHDDSIPRQSASRPDPRASHLTDRPGAPLRSLGSGRAYQAPPHVQPHSRVAAARCPGSASLHPLRPRVAATHRGRQAPPCRLRSGLRARAAALAGTARTLRLRSLRSLRATVGV